MAKTWKQIEQSRERRLWIKEIVMPVILVIAGLMSQVNIRNCVSQKWCDFKNWTRNKITAIKSKFKK